MVITDWALPDLVERLSRIRAPIAVQHRDPTAPTRSFLERARKLKALCDERGWPLFVNGRLDVALLVGAHLHLPEDAPDVSDVRPHLRDRLVSVAFHRGTPVSRAAGADFAIVSPVFKPGSKPNDTREVLGPDGFHALVKTLPCPALALGGMDEASTRTLQPFGVAAISSVLLAKDPNQAASAILSALPPRA